MKALLILASSSPRRRELLSDYFRLRIIKPETDETQKESESALRYVRRVSQQKWWDVSQKVRGSSLILSCDTTVIHRGRVLGKPESAAEARHFLRQLSGDHHDVVSSFTYGRRGEAPKTESSKTRILFRTLSSRELSLFIQSEEWKGKAGAYAIQGFAARFVAEIRGSLTNVIGLPLEKVLQRLKPMI